MFGTVGRLSSRAGSGAMMEPGGFGSSSSGLLPGNSRVIGAELSLYRGLAQGPSSMDG